MIQVLRKLRHRLVDPIFYRERFRQLLRIFRKKSPPADMTALDSIGKLPKKVLVVVAHPDDEIFCSGLLIQLVERGAAVKILCVTKGEGGPTGGTPRSDLGEKREGEMQKSCEVLGVESVVFLGHLDPVGDEFRAYPPDVSVTDLAGQISAHLKDYDWVISHGSNGEYAHPAHILVYEVVRELAGRFPFQWFTFLAHQSDHPIPRLVNLDDAPFLTVDTSAQSEKRCRALECHQSQLALFGRFAGGTHRDFIEKTSIESYARPQSVE